MSFYHGVRTISLPATGGTIAVNESCVIGLIGVSPVGPTQQLVLCNNATDDAQFGAATPDNNIAKTLATIRSVVQGASTTGSDGSCPIVVVNAYNATNHKSSYTTGSPLVATPDATTGKVALAKTWIAATLDLVKIYKHSDASAVNVAAGGSYTYGVDYTLDAYGNFTDITGTYKNVQLNFVGDYLNTSGVAGTDIIGSISGSTRTGSKLLDLVAGTYGFKVKIVIAPTYATLSGVEAALEASAGSYRGVWISDAASGTTKSAALALRGSGQWNTSLPQTRPVFPWLKAYDAYANANVAYPFSAFLAGIYVANDGNVGYWQSVSNQQIPGVVGVDMDITTSFTDPNSDSNLLNAQGIMTYLTGYGLGYRTWGNRNASYPSSSAVTTFDNVYRTDGMVSDAMEAAALPYVDQSINAALIDVIATTGNNFIKSLIQEGALLPGSSIVYNKADNSPSDLAAGIVKFRRIYMVPTPAEQIIFYDILDINLYANL